MPGLTQSVRQERQCARLTLHVADKQVDQTGFEQQARQVLGRYTGDITGLAAGSVSSALQALLAVFILYYFTNWKILSLVWKIG